jgi:S-DNA-T family DNA segregation ATPase FtsK/SpoIIIE
VIQLGSGPAATGALVVTIDAGGRATRSDGAPDLYADGLDAASADAVARAMAGMHLEGDVAGPTGVAGGDPLAGIMSLADLLAPDRPDELDVTARWANRPATDRLRVALGRAAHGDVLTLDLNEPALGGMGPHGLLVGATGSGKSELLRTLVLGLALDHAPDDVSFVLVDFKGGAAFAGLGALPHVAGLITNLADDQALVDRMHDALRGELRRRQELLRSAGQLASRHEYVAARATRPDLPALPSLLVIIDEFAELLEAKPDFIELFGAIGRLGRSLGIHLLFSSQRLDEGRLRGLESHLSYRIALRTFSASDSRVVIGTDDAFTLPSVPGVGILKVDTRVYTAFRCALSSGAWRPPAPPEPAMTSAADAQPAVRPFGPARDRMVSIVPQPGGPAPAPTTRRRGGDPQARPRPLLDLLVERVTSRQLPGTRPVWLPPLPATLTLDAVLAPAPHPERGLQATNGPLGTLAFPFGLADLPDEQRKEVAVFDATAAGGNLMVVGAPQTGKSTLLRSMIAGAALTHTAAEIQIYALDLGGGGLDALAGLPHVGAVAGRHEPERVSRIISQVEQLLERRGRLFAARGIDGLASFRALRARGDLPDEPHGDVFLVIDNWAVFRTEFEELADRLGDLATRSASFGVHLVVTANRAMDLRYNLKDLFGNRLELRLTDPSDSEIDRRIAATLPKSPGRGLRADARQVQAALPRIDGAVDVTGLAEGVSALVTAVCEAWHGPDAPPVRLLPTLTTLDEVDPTRAGTAPDGGFIIGLDETVLGPIGLSLGGTDPHAVILGDTSTGKTNLLLTLAHSIANAGGPETARFLVVDPRRTMLGRLPEDHMAAYCPTPAAAEEALGRLAATLAQREPPADLSMQQVRDRSWWSGPEIYVLIDDYELWANARQNPLAGLAEWLPHAVDLGLHVVVARRMGGAGRALYDPLIQQLRELCDQGLMLSGDPAEGQLLGNVKPLMLPAGRAVLIRRRNPPTIVQTAFLPDEP